MSIRLLLADDHAVVRAGIANALRELSEIEIVGEIGDGDALLAALARTHPDVLVTDVTMPSFEPVSTIRHIRERYPALKILIVSAYDDDEYVQGLLGAGVNGYHLKDQPLADLRLAVQRVLAGERWVCSPLVDKLIRLRDQPGPALALTARQRDILRCLREGLDNQGIARRTGLSVKTVENHLTRLYRQIGVQSRLEAVHYLTQHRDLLGPEEPTRGAAPGGDQAAARPPAILIVDDNLRYRTQMRRMVDKTCPRAAVHEAENTRAALRLAEETRPQIAFVDVVLGDEHGIEAARLIRQTSPATKIILISAYPDREFHRQGLAAGATAFLDKKDIDAAALRELINDLIGL
ncbi:MAG: response regulator [Roseiflexaceae bacterium]